MGVANASWIQVTHETPTMLSYTGWTVQDWQQAYRAGATPDTLLTDLWSQIHADDPAWIARATMPVLQDALAQLAQRLQACGGDTGRLPLYGVPFAAKDNIDAVGFDTTAGCPEYAYAPDQDADVIARLRAAGAILMGKTNLDQFATGLVGTRSPYGAVPNAFDPAVISGGSSSGSASVVARGLVAFSLGTDTAGSGRVPAGLNNLVGLKPTRGLFSTEGVVPACRSLDCVSIFSLTVGDAARVSDVMGAYNPNDAFSRPRALPHAPGTPALRRPGPVRRLAIPADPDWFGDHQAATAWEQTLATWGQLDVTLVPTDFSLLAELAALLYEGPWVAERHAAVRDFMAAHADAINPVVRGIIAKADNFSATDTFEGLYRREQLIRAIDQQLADIDAILVPTAPIAPTIAEVDADPVVVNSRMGTYINFVNFADMSALAVPAGFRGDGLPFGVTLISGAWRDRDLQQLALTWLAHSPTTLGATGLPRPTDQLPTESAADTIAVAVVGAHLSGMPLNSQLTERKAWLRQQTTTAPHYQLYALPDTTPPKPGLRRMARDEGKPIIVEVWEMPIAAFGSFVALIPSPLGIGSVELADGQWVNSFICEGYALEHARDVTEFGGWRAYIASLNEVQKTDSQSR